MSLIPATGYVEQPITRQFTQNAGWQTVRTFKGDQSSIEALAESFAATGYDVTLTQGPGDAWQLEATTGTNTEGGVETPVDTWELMANEVEKDILTADVSGINAMDAADYTALRAKLDGTSTVTAEPTWATSPSTVPSGLWKIISAGTKAVNVYAPTLRHTKTVSRSYEIPASFVGYGQVFSSARLISDESPPTSIASQFPTSSYVTKNGYTNGFYYGWLKGFPTIQTSAYGKTQLVQDWRFGLWAVVCYTINA